MRSKKPVARHNLKTTRRGKVKKRSIIWRWRRLLYLSFLSLTVLVAGMAYIVSKVQLPGDPSVAPTEAQTSFICSAEVQVNCNASNAMAQLHGAEDRSLVTYQQIPKVLRQAVISAEDREFFKHGGVDPVGIARAAWADIRGKGAQQGGSTITQQYVKNTYLNRERTVTRKIKEAVMAVKLEQKLSKQEILTRYLNTIYFGRGAYGVQAASRAWFNHDVGSLQLTEAAFLAGLIRSPQSADPFKGKRSLAEAIRRRHVVLQAMLGQKYITARQMRAAEAQKLQWPLIALPPTTANLGNVAGQDKGMKYFVDYVRSFLLSHFGEAAVYSGGLKVYTTVDRTMQAAAYDAVTTTLDRPDDPAGALVAIDDQGQVKAMMGGRRFEESHVNLATGSVGGGSGRQPGSTFKAFALAEAVREGYSVQSVFKSPSTLDLPDGNGPGSPWIVNGGFGNGTATLVQATQHSVNTVYAQLAATLGMDKVINMAHELGVSKSAVLKNYPSTVLGSGAVSVLDMASAYSTFADQGEHVSPIVVTRVERPDGSVVNFVPDRGRVLAPDQAARVTYCLQRVVQAGTGTAADFGIPAAGKTGTTTANVDAWFVGYTPKLTAAVWMGYPEGESRSMDNVHGITVQGGTLPAEMWRKFMQAVTANTDPGTFPDPGDLDVGIKLNPELSTVTGPFTGPSLGPTPATLPPSARGTTASSTAPPSTTAPSTKPSTKSTTTTKTSKPPTSAPTTSTAPKSKPKPSVTRPKPAPPTTKPKPPTSAPTTATTAPKPPKPKPPVPKSPTTGI
ncbi:MAG: transglycosylase domain-containing protein [Actinomycetota bacterium]|nr:transglycosylase domain-containing protein [Actinomycetota bacterium]